MKDEGEKFDPSGQFGLRNSLEHYLTYNGQNKESGYFLSAVRQSELLSIPPGGTVVELAGGTGNSSLAFLNSHKTPIGRYLILDRSESVTIAGRRFNQVSDESWKKRISNISIPNNVSNDIESSQNKASTFSTHIHVVQSKTQELPFPQGIADGVFSVQSFHWFLFADEDIGGNNPQYVLKTLNEVRRIIKKGGEFTFDTHGGAMDFGNVRTKGKLLNDLYFRHHPLVKAFDEILNNELQKLGFHTRIDTRRPNKYFKS
jgi:ubiquinone/menaquinone biosynthesis C-methylase UbiE